MRGVFQQKKNAARGDLPYMALSNPLVDITLLGSSPLIIWL